MLDNMQLFSMPVKNLKLPGICLLQEALQKSGDKTDPSAIGFLTKLQ